MRREFLRRRSAATQETGPAGEAGYAPSEPQPVGGRGAVPAANGEAPAEPRGGRRGRAQDAGAAAVGAVGSGVIVVARLVMTIAALIAVLIALAVVLRDVDANSSNTIVKGIHEGANFFAGAFTGLITFAGHPKREITVDWGIALLAYLIVGGVIASAIAGVGRGGLSYERRHRTLPSH